MTDIGRGRPVAPEVPALDEDVRGRDDAPVGRGHDCGVVAGSEQNGVAAAQPGGDAVDQTEFAGLRDSQRKLPPRSRAYVR